MSKTPNKSSRAAESSLKSLGQSSENKLKILSHATNL